MEDHVVCDSVYMTYPKIGKFIETESKLVVARRERG
jgi:hypothetical protein